FSEIHKAYKEVKTSRKEVQTSRDPNKTPEALKSQLSGKLETAKSARKVVKEQAKIPKEGKSSNPTSIERALGNRDVKAANSNLRTAYMKVWFNTIFSGAGTIAGLFKKRKEQQNLPPPAAPDAKQTEPQATTTPP